MINRILLLACDRPTYLLQTLKRALMLNVEIVCVLDKPSNGNLEGWEKCKEILKRKKIITIQNNESLGCTRSMFSLLTQYKKGINLILEDDIVLSNDFESEIQETLKSIDQAKPFIIKLNSFYWGWLANDIALDIFDKFRNQNVDSIRNSNKTDWKAIEIFQKQDCKFFWDELFDKSLKYTDINSFKTEKALTINIGEDSSRLNNSESNAANPHFVLFKNGKISKIGEIDKNGKEI